MLTIGINHVATITNDSDRLQAFYREVFDAETLSDSSEFPDGTGPRLTVIGIGPSARGSGHVAPPTTSSPISAPYSASSSATPTASKERCASGIPTVSPVSAIHPAHALGATGPNPERHLAGLPIRRRRCT